MSFASNEYIRDRLTHSRAALSSKIPTLVEEHDRLRQKYCRMDAVMRLIYGAKRSSYGEDTVTLTIRNTDHFITCE